MFHISHDKRSRTSAQKLLEALTHLIEERELDCINVSELCAEAGLSRPTFYRLFDTPADIILWFCDTQTKDLAEVYKAKDNTDINCPFRTVLRHVLEHPQALELAYRARRTDLLEASFIKNVEPQFAAMRDKNGLDNHDIRMGGSIVISILIATVSDWMANGRKESADEIYDRVTCFIHGIG